MFSPSLSTLVQLQDNFFEGTLTISRHSVQAIDRFNNLQLQTLKVTFEEASEHLGALMTATDAASANSILQAWLEPGPDKFQSWLGHVKTISTETGTELAKDWEKQIAGSGTSLQTVLESAANQTSAGEQGLFPWMLQAESK